MMSHDHPLATGSLFERIVRSGRMLSGFILGKPGVAASFDGHVSRSEDRLQSVVFVFAVLVILVVVVAILWLSLRFLNPKISES